MNTRIGKIQYRIFSADFLKAYITTMRPYLLFVSGITGIAGMSLVPELSTAKAILIFVASFLSYGFGQALTDCFQVDTDSLSSPYRPLTRGMVTRNQILIVSLLGLTCCTAVFATFNPVNLLLGCLAGLGLATYTPFKRRWWAGPFYNAWIVVVLCMIAFLCGGHDFMTVFSSPFVWLAPVVFFGYANFVLSGYFKDISADRPTGYRTLPVVFGRRVSAWVSDAFALMTVAFAAIAISQSKVRVHPPMAYGVGIGFGLFGVLAAVLGQVQLHMVRTDEEAHRAISPVVHSYMLLLSCIAVFQKPEWAFLLAVFYAAFVLVMKARPARNQI
jgi:geranylgeranylglycerol-phosphate geranylgeranyltransferase